MKVEEIKKLIMPSEELINELKRIIEDRYESCSEYSICDNGLIFEFNGINYGLIEVGEQPVTDEGKYQYGEETYQFVEFDKTITSYPCEKYIIKKFNLFVDEEWSRSGSYFSDYYYEYEKPSLFSYEVTIVPEVVIPEHEEAVVKNI